MKETYILQINTAFSTASIGIAKNGVLLVELNNPDQHDHAAFIQPAIQTLCTKAGVPLNKLDAIAIINGPGSYTGLRVGLSAAKGICYALNIPLICINTLTWMAEAHLGEEATLIAPMIDARRDEVFTAIFDHKGNIISAPAALKLTENSFERELNNHAVSFVGDGAIKWKNTCKHPRAAFPSSTYNAHHLAKLALAYFTRNEFADLAYSEPFYVKDFYSTQKK
jgi:tRNA threonylcarbamoyladenosine biosynthesis protein TsaB